VRYTIALAVSLLLIGGGFLFIRQTHHSLREMVREGLRKQKQAGTLPPDLQGVDIETVDKLPDMQISLPRAMETRLKLSLWLSELWYLWVPATVAVCLAAAAVLGRRRPEV
jgi:hypothetical protein